MVFTLNQEKNIYMVPQHQIFNLNIMQLHKWSFVYKIPYCCIQDTLSSRAKLGLPALGRLRRASKGILHTNHIVARAWLVLVYKIPYRRAPRLACRVRRANKSILHTRLVRVRARAKLSCIQN